MNFIHSIILVSLLALMSCSNTHFISDPAERLAVQQDFDSKRQEFPANDLFSIFEDVTNTKEREALMFLYAYMPIGDITDHPGNFHLENIRSSFLAREEMPWGKMIPEREFRHFVLPARVNNENLDSARQVFYRELKDRVKDLSLYDAVLEVNHWCHEKVIYTPSDARTSSPLASIKTAYGRCGEESTLLVAALRSVGIPARQVYTPRWAHTDDNHAWVEAWVDGKWYFLGACEPEPVLNLGWFNAPASRGMLMHTNVFGRYAGPEEVMSQTPGYTEINVIGNYAPTAHAVITVTDSSGQPVPEAKVDFKIYNYAEFYTAASRSTDQQGHTSLTAGKGDMLVWASKNGNFGYGKLSFAKDSALTIVLDKREGAAYSLPLDIVPPAENTNPVKVTPEQQAINNSRIAREDSIRNIYTATFVDTAKAGSIARSLDTDSTELVPLLIASRGNHPAITDFLSATDKAQRPTAMRLLKVISAKDLRDTPASILDDHLQHTPFSDSPLFYDYVLNPRIGNEMLSPYKSFFTNSLDQAFISQIRNDPDFWINWCKDSITIKEELNSKHIPISPAGVWKARIADKKSRNIFFVAVLRSAGIPARIDQVTGKIQYSKGTNQAWTDVNFTAPSQNTVSQGYLTATYHPAKALLDPQYYTHYTLSRFDNGQFQLLNFPENNSSSWHHLLSSALPLDSGYYMLTTGTRLASGSVLSNVTFFNIHPGSRTTIDLVMRENPDEIKVIGNFNSETTFRLAGEDSKPSILQTCGRGYFVVAILGARQEPTNHALRDIAACKDDFEAWGRKMIFLFPDEQQLKNFHPAEFPGLPSNIVWGTDLSGQIQEMIIKSIELKDNTLPIFIIADTFNRVVFISQGYTIGLGEQLLKTIHKL